MLELLKKIKKFLTFNYNFEFSIFNLNFLKILILFIIFIFFSKPIFSEELNNKFGIHLAQPHLEDLPKVKELVNSNGGDWGYITLIIQENDLDKNKWQTIFDHLRRLHLIPIIRIATVPEGSNWKRPVQASIKNWVDFLDSLNWVVKNRYIVLFNEPNHGFEWGGEVDPKSYAEISLAFSKALKEKNNDFFVMLAGFDASAPHRPPVYWDEEIFLREFFNYFSIDDFNRLISGWASHSYPNPGFSGSPYDSGRGTIRTYEWEINLLRNFGVKKDLPVFITETGWERKLSKKYLNEETVANNFRIAFENFWLKDERVQAVTPFVFDYQMDPFLGFSWKKQGSNDFYLQYYIVQSISKIKGNPRQIEKGEIKFNLSKELINESDYHFKITLLNKGQGYWTDNIYQIEVDNSSGFKFLSGSFEIAPFEEKEVNIYLKTISQGKEKVRFFLKKNEEKILESNYWDFEILPLPSFEFEVSYWPWGRAEGNDFQIEIFDWEEKLVYKKDKIKVKDGVGLVENIKNITLSDLYRIVLLKPGFLPRQNYFVFRPKDNKIKFKKILPFDKNQDGKFSFDDVVFLLKGKG